MPIIIVIYVKKNFKFIYGCKANKDTHKTAKIFLTANIYGTYIIAIHLRNSPMALHANSCLISMDCYISDYFEIHSNCCHIWFPIPGYIGQTPWYTASPHSIERKLWNCITITSSYALVCYKSLSDVFSYQKHYLDEPRSLNFEILSHEYSSLEK